MLRWEVIQTLQWYEWIHKTSKVFISSPWAYVSGESSIAKSSKNITHNNRFWRWLHWPGWCQWKSYLSFWASEVNQYKKCISSNSYSQFTSNQNHIYCLHCTWHVSREFSFWITLMMNWLSVEQWRMICVCHLGHAAAAFIYLISQLWSRSRRVLL